MAESVRIANDRDLRVLAHVMINAANKQAIREVSGNVIEIKVPDNNVNINVDKLKEMISLVAMQQPDSKVTFDDMCLGTEPGALFICL